MDQLAGNSQFLLSGNFRKWYGCMIPGLIIGQGQHPHFILRPVRALSSYANVVDKPANVIKRLDKAIDESEIILGSDKNIIKELFQLKKICLIDYLEDMPPITSSDIFMDKRKICKLLTFDQFHWYCVIELESFDAYLKSKKIIDSVLCQYNKQYKPKFAFKTIPQCIIVAEKGRHFFITKFCGQTLEQGWGDLCSTAKNTILKQMREFLNTCEQLGVYWRDFAPRNILIDSDGCLVFIDFENIYLTKELVPSDRIILDRYRRIWFADILTQKEIDFIYDLLPVAIANRHEICKADKLEQIYFDSKLVSLDERLGLIDLIAFVERRHQYQGVSVFGHRLGLYMSDFLDDIYEAYVYLILINIKTALWPKFLYALQLAIDIDQYNYILYIYGQGEETRITEKLIVSMRTKGLNQELLDEEIDKWILSKKS